MKKHSPFVVGLGYKARHGKDTIAQMIHDRVPQGTRIYSFASALKAHCRVMGWMEEKNGPILQYVGTELYRKKEPDLWVKVLRLQIEEENPLVALVPDMRFENEKKWVEQNGISVRVERVNEDGSPFVATDRPANHASEIALDGAEFNYSYKIKSGDFKKLEQAADEIIGLIRNNMAKVWSS